MMEARGGPPLGRSSAGSAARHPCVHGPFDDVRQDPGGGDGCAIRVVAAGCGLHKVDADDVIAP